MLNKIIRLSGKRSKRSKLGISLVEFLTGLAMVLILGAGLTSLYLMSMKAWRTGSAQVVLQRKLATAVKKMVYGQRVGTEDKTHGLREAETIEVIDDQTIQFKSGVDGNTRRFYLVGNELKYSTDLTNDYSDVAIYDPSRSERSSETDNHRTDVKFTKLSTGAVEIQLQGERRLGNQWITAALITKVAPRN